MTWHNIALHYITFPCIALHCSSMHCSAVRCVPFHSIPFRSIPSHSIPFHYITLYIYACIYIYTWLWFPKCLPTVSGPSIVPCHNMGQSHHHLRLPINVGSRPLFWGTRGKIARTPFWWLLKGVDPISFGKVWTPWTFGWTIGWETISGEIYFDLLEAASGTAVAVTLVAEPGGSCYQARKAWQWWEIL